MTEGKTYRLQKGFGKLAFLPLPLPLPLSLSEKREEEEEEEEAEGREFEIH
jgi:hypothetical protein